MSFTLVEGFSNRAETFDHNSYMERYFNYQFADVGPLGRPASSEGIDFARQRNAGFWAQEYENDIKRWDE